MKHLNEGQEYLDQKHEELLNAARQLFKVASPRNAGVRPDVEQVEKQLIRAAIGFGVAEDIRSYETAHGAKA